VLREHRLDGARLAVLGPGAIYGPAKRWEAERFTELGRRLAARGFNLAVCGTAAERETCAAVAAGIAERHPGSGAVASLAGVTTLEALSGVCAGASLAVCNDSGLAHLSAALGTATVTIFGSTSSAWTAPLGARVRVIQHAPVCSPCFQRRCRIGMPCLTAVSVDEVEAACLEAAA
jgi:lipopolysaccharide heptosyltransferase II